MAFAYLWLPILPSLKNIFQNKAFQYYLLLIALVVDRYFILSTFNFNYVGNDDTIFWQAANDYANGVFHEPYFYGQNYNVMLEALFAVPLIKLGIPYYIALPLCTSFISLFPFVLFSIVLFKNKEYQSSLIFLAIPICLPVEYGMLTSMSRGFVQGLFFTGFYVFALLKPHKKLNWILSSAAMGAAYVCNPNSLVVSFPIGLFLVYTNYKQISFYFLSLSALIPILFLEYLAKLFYVIHPEYNVHPLMPIDFDWDQLIYNLKFFNDFYSFYTPVIWFKGWLVLPLLFIISLFLLKQHASKAIIIMATILLIIITLGINKVNDSIHHLLLSSARMYLGIPLITGIALVWAKPIPFFSNPKMPVFILIISLSVFFIKSGLSQPHTDLITKKTNYGCVAIKPIQSLKTDCFKLKKLIEYHQVDLVVFVPNWIINTADMAIYNCSCNLLEKDFPQNVMSDYEKRNWVFYGEKTKVRKNILLYGHYLERKDRLKIKNCTLVSINPDILLIKDNQIQLDSLLQKAGIPYKNSN